MAYKQSPGRQAMPKTGRGISPTLMSCSAKKGSPMKQTSEPDLTRQGSESRRKVQAGAKSRAASAKTDPQGIKVDPKSGTATAKPYEKKFVGGRAESSNKKVPTDAKRTKAMLVEGSGKLVKEAKKGNEQLYREYKADSTNTMNSRNRNARMYNVQAGKASPTAREAREGQNRGFYAK